MMPGIKNIPYDSFRTGLTFADVYSIVWVNNPDSRYWPKTRAQPSERKDGSKTRKGLPKKTSGRRHTVLGKWRQIKLQMYHEYLMQQHPTPEMIEEIQYQINKYAEEYPF
jgi:hypothetical protein